MTTCCYCGARATISRRSYVGDTRELCNPCDEKDQPGGFWTFHPEAKPARLDKPLAPVCLQCSSPIPSGRTNGFCSEECETSHDRAAYEEGL